MLQMTSLPAMTSAEVSAQSTSPRESGRGEGRVGRAALHEHAAPRPASFLTTSPTMGDRVSCSALAGIPITTLMALLCAVTDSGY